MAGCFLEGRIGGDGGDTITGSGREVYTGVCVGDDLRLRSLVDLSRVRAGVSEDLRDSFRAEDLRGADSSSLYCGGATCRT